MEATFFRNIKPVLALSIMIFGFAYFFMVTFLEKQNDQVLIAVVALTSMAGNYYFGNSQGSSKKDETIATLSNNPVVTNSDTTIVNTSTDENK